MGLRSVFSKQGSSTGCSWMFSCFQTAAVTAGTLFCVHKVDIRMHPETVTVITTLYAASWWASFHPRWQHAATVPLCVVSATLFRFVFPGTCLKSLLFQPPKHRSRVSCCCCGRSKPSFRYKTTYKMNRKKDKGFESPRPFKLWVFFSFFLCELTKQWDTEHLFPEKCINKN